MLRKRYALTIVGAVALLAALAACSALPSATTTTPPTASTAPTQSDDRTFTKSDLAGILNSVNASLGLHGTVETQDGPQTQALDSLRAAIGDSPTFSPSSCGTLIESDVQVGSKGVVTGTLSSEQLNFIVSTVPSANLPPALMSGFASTQSAILSTCKHMTITATVDGQDASVAVDFTRLADKTDASQSVAFTEKFAITEGGGGTTSSRTVVEAVDGNLLLLASGVTEEDASALAKVINAGVAAARS